MLANEFLVGNGSLLKKGLIHCMASDAHGLQKRQLGITDGLRRAVDLLGQENVYQMIEARPAGIINNDPFHM